MKRLLLSLFFAALPLGAQANTGLAQQWGVEANRLSVETATLIHALDMGHAADISETYALDVYRFGRTSADLAHWIDRSEGPHDLGCIFRGMASESESQLNLLESQLEISDQRASLQRLAGMFADAEIIAIAAQRNALGPERAASSSVQSCAAAPQRAEMLKLR
jgi:hypothetical protein